MAVIGEITEASSVSDFLKGSETDEVVGKIESGKISSLEEEFNSKLLEEEKKGLSLEALNIDNRAPLNEVSMEMRARIAVSIEDIKSIITLAKNRGYEHTKGEAEKFLKEVLKKYKELCEKADKALKSYGNASYTKSYKDGDEEKTKTVHCSHSITISYEISGESTTKITMKGSKDSDSKFNDEYSTFEAAFKEAESYYDSKVKEAIEFSKEASKLSPPSVAGIPIATTNDAKRPEGVQPDAKKEKEEIDDQGNGYRIYRNPDGSKTKVTYKHGIPSDTKVTNRYGYTTETIKYDDKGNITHKNVWSYHKVEGQSNVYESEYTRYEKDENGEWKAVGEATTYGYSYPDKEGNIKNIRGETPPDSSEVGTPKSFTGGSASEDDIDSKTASSDKSGTKGSESKNDSAVETVTDFSLRETLKNKKDFILPKGSTIIEDRKGLYNQKYYFKNEDVYFEYDKDDNVYYAKNSDGNYINGLGMETSKSDLKKQKDYLDIDNYLKGTGSAPVNDEFFVFSNNSRSDIK